MDIPLSTLDSVAFLEIKEINGFVSIGTCFFITHFEGDMHFLYLITCRHVIKEHLERSEQIYVRLNLADGPGVERIPLHEKWIYHKENGIDLVDLALIPLEHIESEYKEFAPVNIGSLNSDKIYGREGIRRSFTRDMQVGDDILFIGVFQHYQGHSKNYPLVRFGRIALITNEGLPGVEPWLGVSDYFLVECQAYPGMSGSPVYAMIEYEGKERYFLVGVMAGYYIEDEQVALKFSHFGISQVVPIEKLGDIIFGEALDMDRKAKIRQ